MTPVLVGATIRILVMLVVHVYHGSFLFLDDQGYDKVGWALATAWHHHTFPNPGSYAYGGSANYGYFVYVAAIYYVFGHSTIVVGLFNACLSSLACYFAGAIAEEVGGKELTRPAAWMMALYPTAIFWGSVGLKDGVEASIWLAAVAISLRQITLTHLLTLGLLLVAILFTRPPLIPSILLILAVPLGQAIRSSSRTRWGRVVRGHKLLGSLALIMVIAISIKGAVTFGHLLESQPSSPVLQGRSAFTLSNFTPKAITRDLLGPFPWDFGQGSQGPMRWMYPGMVEWILLLPAGIIAAGSLLRHGSNRSRALVLGVVANIALYLSYSAYGSGAFRERFDAESIILILALTYLRRRPQNARVVISAWICLVGPGALVQAGAISAKGVGAVVFFGGAILMARQLVRSRRHRPSTRELLARMPELDIGLEPWSRLEPNSHARSNHPVHTRSRVGGPDE